MASTCITSLDLCAIRVSKVTEAGAPVPGASNGYISDAPQSLGVTVTTESGEDLTMETGCGIIVATQQSPDQIKGVELDLNLCQLDAALIGLMTGAHIYTDGSGNAIGFEIAESGTSPPPVCLEGWSKAWETDHQLIHDFVDADTWIHWVFPLTRWVQGDFTMEHDLMVVPLSGKGSGNPNVTVNGPFDDWPAQIAAQGGVSAAAGWFLDDGPPAATCDYVTVTSAAS